MPARWRRTRKPPRRTQAERRVSGPRRRRRRAALLSRSLGSQSWPSRQVSFSALSAFGRCPRRFYLERRRWAWAPLPLPGARRTAMARARLRARDVGSPRRRGEHRTAATSASWCTPSWSSIDLTGERPASRGSARAGGDRGRRRAVCPYRRRHRAGGRAGGRLLGFSAGRRPGGRLRTARGSRSSSFRRA